MSQQLRKAAAAAPPQHFANFNFTHHFYLQTTLTADLGHYRFHIQVLHDYYYSAAKTDVKQLFTSILKLKRLQWLTAGSSNDDFY